MGGLVELSCNDPIVIVIFNGDNIAIIIVCTIGMKWELNTKHALIGVSVLHKSPRMTDLNTIWLELIDWPSSLWILYESDVLIWLIPLECNFCFHLFLQVNGRDLQHASHSEAVAVLKQSGELVEIICQYRPEGQSVEIWTQTCRRGALVIESQSLLYSIKAESPSVWQLYRNCKQ